VELIGVIGVFFFALFGIFATAVSRQLADEFKAWTPRLIKYFIQRAVRQLPESQRKRFTEEWESHVDEIPGEVGKLIVAFGFLRASSKMSRGLTDAMPDMSGQNLKRFIYTLSNNEFLMSALGNSSRTSIIAGETGAFAGQPDLLAMLREIPRRARNHHDLAQSHCPSQIF
jgi:hypothetical protein